ncbi:MAG: hypothetical protein M3Z05_21070 [Gemmatimonadota bacterium]|nr:hypothetical protein [Gemmatimonadota bacterium]
MTTKRTAAAESEMVVRELMRRAFTPGKKPRPMRPARRKPAVAPTGTRIQLGGEYSVLVRSRQDNRGGIVGLYLYRETQREPLSIHLRRDAARALVQALTAFLDEATP